MAAAPKDDNDIASLLLQSADERIAKAAARVFSPGSDVSVVGSVLSSATHDAITRLHDRSDSKGDGNFTSNYCSKQLTSHHAREKNTTKISIKKKTDVGTPETKTNEYTTNKKPTSTERSRERNRMHARKTRQRKKELLQKLQHRANELKLEQIRLKQAIHEKNSTRITANILVGLFAGAEEDSASPDSRVESLLKRPTENIPDASKIPELPALVLPGHHNIKMGKPKSCENEQQHQLEGIDYKLLGKDRSSCTQVELDQIRRERNRMHAKRTRDRKRIYMEEIEVMCKTLEEENILLQSYYKKLASNLSSSSNLETAVQHTAACPRSTSGPISKLTALPTPSTETYQSYNSKGDFMDQINSLLAAAGSFQRVTCEINAISCAESDASASSTALNDLCEDYEHGHLDKKARRVPESITTTSLTI